MPTVARFYGIFIKMCFRDHGTPHFPAVYSETIGVFDIATLELIEGDLPVRAQRLVVEWGQIHRADLQRMWETQEFRQLPGLDP